MTKDLLELERDTIISKTGEHIYIVFIRENGSDMIKGSDIREFDTVVEQINFQNKVTMFMKSGNYSREGLAELFRQEQ